MGLFALLAAGVLAASGGGELLAERNGTLVLLRDGDPRPRVLVEGPLGSREYAGAPAWSGDGRRVAFGLVRGRARNQGPVLVVLDMATGRRRTVDTPRTPASSLAVAPDGSRVAYGWLAGEGLDLRSGIDVVDVATGQARTVAGNDALELVAWPSWSPDGAAIAYTRMDYTVAVGHQPDTAIMLVPAAGGAASRLSPPLAQDSQPAWSPDGSRLAFASGADGNGQTCNDFCRPHGEVYTMAADGSDRRRITTTPADELLPSWSTAGRRLVWVRQSQLVGANADGSCARDLTRDTLGYGSPVWRPATGTDVRYACGAHRPAVTVGFSRIGSDVDAAGLRRMGRDVWWLGLDGPRYALSGIGLATTANPFLMPGRIPPTIRLSYACRADAPCTDALMVAVAPSCLMPSHPRSRRVRGAAVWDEGGMTVVRTGAVEVQLQGRPADRAWALAQLRGASRRVLDLGPGEPMPAAAPCPDA